MAAPSSTVGSDWRAGLPLSPPLWLVAWPGSHTYTHTYTHPEPITVAGLGHTALPLSPTAVADGLAWITHTCACPHAHTLNQSPWPKAQGYELEAGLMTGPPPLSLGLQVCGPRCVLHLQPTVMALIVWLGAHAHPKAIPWWRERSRSMSVSTLVPEDRAARPPQGTQRNAGSPLHYPSLSPSRPGGPAARPLRPSPYQLRLPRGCRAAPADALLRLALPAGLPAAVQVHRSGAEAAGVPGEGVGRSRPGDRQEPPSKLGAAGQGVKSSDCETRGAPPPTS